MAGLEFISQTTVGSGGATSVTISVPSGYRHLLVKGSVRSERNSAYDGSSLYFNGDTTNGNYSDTVVNVAGQASPNAADEESEWRISYTVDGIGSRDQTDAFATSEVWILDYAATDKFKGVIGGSCAPGIANDTWDYEHSLVHGHWKSTAAITSLTFKNGVGDFAEDSTFTLYGLNSA